MEESFLLIKFIPICSPPALNNSQISLFPVNESKFRRFSGNGSIDPNIDNSLTNTTANTGDIFNSAEQHNILMEVFRYFSMALSGLNTALNFLSLLVFSKWRKRPIVILLIFLST